MKKVISNKIKKESELELNPNYRVSPWEGLSSEQYITMHEELLQDLKNSLKKYIDLESNAPKTFPPKKPHELMSHGLAEEIKEKEQYIQSLKNSTL